jgi:hypothetical protein
VPAIDSLSSHQAPPFAVISVHNLLAYRPLRPYREECIVPSCNPVTEFRRSWLPHVTDEGLDRLIDLLEKASPLLIHGAFTRAMPMGCLASHIAWNHEKTAHLQHEAGVMWLSRVANLNPATSSVILAWDRAGVGDFELRTGLLAACAEEKARRAEVAECELVGC